MTERSGGIDIYRATVLGALSLLTIVLGITGWLAADLIQQDRKAIDDIGGQQTETARSLNDVSARVSAIEASRSTAIADAADMRKLILGKLDDLSKAQNEAVAKIATLTATVEGMQSLLNSQLRRLGMNDPSK